MLTIENVSVHVEAQTPLQACSLEVNPGEMHVLMGANGAGKSSLARALIGDEAYSVQAGMIRFKGQDLNALSVDERACQGLFLAFQNPVAIPGVNNLQFLKAAVNAKRAAQGQHALDAVEFMSLAQHIAEAIRLEEDFLYRDVNEGFSGGERKRNELLQLLLLEPELAILDELDSGLDVDALKTMAYHINGLRRDKNTAFIVISHYLQWIETLNPSHVHVIKAGHIAASGDIGLARHIAHSGFDTVALNL